MKRVAIFQTDFAIGGIQTSLRTLLNELNQENVKIDVYLGESIEEDFDSNNIRFKVLKKYPVVFKFIPFALARHFCENKTDWGSYDLAVDYNGYSFDTALAAVTCNATKRVTWVHSDYETRIKKNHKFKVLWMMMKKKYDYFDQVICVSKGAEKSFKRLLGKDIPTTIIPNLVHAENILSLKDAQDEIRLDSKKYHLVTMGRMVHSKGFDLLLDLFNNVHQKREDMILHFIGDGEEMTNLQLKADKLNLQQHVKFWGNQRNPYPILNQMDGFILLPRYEGQGLVFLEAMVLGLQIFTSRRMEEFNMMVTGIDDIEKALLDAEKKPKEYHMLTEYNDQIKKAIQDLFL